MSFNELTKEDKVKLLMGKDNWSNYTADGKLYEFILSDGPVGLRQPINRKIWGGEVHRSVAYPSFQILSQTWDEALSYDMGYSIGNDCIEQDVDILLAPGVNIKRLPNCGRNFEYFSEDPLVSGVFGREYINGVQAKHIGTSLKHFCANNSEHSRHWLSMEIDERTLREIYLKPFEIAARAKPWTVMSAYNLVNGVRMSEHAKLYRVLREDFEFDGAIFSDWEAVKDPEASLNAGLDLEMPYNPDHCKEMLSKIDDLDEEKLNASAKRIVDLSEKCGKESRLREIDMTIGERREVALKIAEEGMVLLKNDSVLPLSGKEKLIVTGAPAVRHYCGGGSSEVTPERDFEPLHEALTSLGADAEYSEGVVFVHSNAAKVGNLAGTVKKAAYKDIAIVCVGDPNSCEFESVDRTDITLCPQEVEEIHALKKACEKVIVVVYAGAPIDMEEWIDDADAVLWAGYGGELSNLAVSKILLGLVNPSGKTTETFPLSLSDVVACNTYRDECCMVYSEGLNVGYRYFDSFDIPVLFPFGYGLSYSEFEYRDLTLTKLGDDIRVDFKITNKSEIDGKEVAEVYVREIAKEVYRPKKELRAFQKVLVEAGRTADVSLILSRNDFAYWSSGEDKWKVNPGMFEICVGKNVTDIELSAKIEIK